MNREILKEPVQTYIDKHLNDDVNKIALGKSAFAGISSAELAGQIAAKKKAFTKLPTWFSQKLIYYPALLSIEQTSSEATARYKSNLALGEYLIDLTAGFGVDSFFFAKKVKNVVSCEINIELSAISAHNAQLLGASNIKCLATDGIDLLAQTDQQCDTIYIDPARRSNAGKVFKLKDCTPNVIEHLDLLLQKAKRIIIKTAPLLDLTAGLNELKQVKEIHIVSVKNECKELVWIIERGFKGSPAIVCATLNEKIKTFSFSWDKQIAQPEISQQPPTGYLYEPDVALLKSGAFNLIGQRFGLQKLHQQSQLYTNEKFIPDFLGRIFEIKEIFQIKDIKKEQSLVGNVIVRNFPDQAANLVKKYKIIPSHDDFILFTQTLAGYVAIKAKILQHY
jgi:16S rRNA G966 N2-methylase RsmD